MLTYKQDMWEKEKEKLFIQHYLSPKTQTNAPQIQELQWETEGTDNDTENRVAQSGDDRTA